ncbi:hypothetical protein E8E13_003646 [Curvularia kusanoi]|uniref:F-box domain-containing protein n=1 Tax=Curvularia kusanoi TaxID=90978 RepID=A0A9P4TD76_CURKU|nr:hypothetical protein E8E13_003646 [Curvularia kusanoi]
MKLKELYLKAAAKLKAMTNKFLSRLLLNSGIAYVKNVSWPSYLSSLTKSNSEFLNYQRSPFLHLPGELRNQIYSYILMGHEIGVEANLQTNHEIFHYPHDLRVLPQVSRQLRRETQPYIANNNTYVFRAKNLNGNQIVITDEEQTDWSYCFV